MRAFSDALRTATTEHAPTHRPFVEACERRLAAAEERLAQANNEKVTLHQDLVYAIKELDKQKVKTDDMMAQVKHSLFVGSVCSTLTQFVDCS